VPRITLEVDEDLRFLLPRGRRHERVWLEAIPTDTVGHVVESIGIPLTEVGRLRLDGVPVSPRDRARPGVITVPTRSRPQPWPTAVPRFVLDIHLGRLARHLWLLGQDALWGQVDDAALAAAAAAEHRILLTQDRGLLRRRVVEHGALVRGSRVSDQVADVLDRFVPPLRPWTRCMACGGEVETITPEQAAAAGIPPGTAMRHREFWRCPSCGRVYWRGAHTRRLDVLVATAQDMIRRASVPR
jgi:uncharacterized protein with PIN domain